MSNSIHALSAAKAAWRTHAMFRAMSADYLLREQFATDPMQIFCDYVFPDRASGLEAETANQLIFSVFSNPHLRRWMGTYSRRLGGRSPSRHVFASQFASAVAASPDPLVALALVRGAAADRDIFEDQADFFRAVLAAMGRGSAASGTEMSPGTATEMSPGTATEMSPGIASFGVAERLAAELASAARFTAELRRVGAEGTEMSPGGGTEMSPGALRLSQALSAALQRAQRFSAQLVRADEGTEMSPGTATEMSPGTATEMSPGVARLSERLATEVGIAARLASSILRAEADGTEMSPGGGTEQSPGGGTEMSPGALRLTEALTAAVRRAELFLGEMVRAASGTEMSPGTATEMSPGQVFGSQWGVQLPAYVAASLGAIVQYAVELRRQGALSVSGLEVG